MTVSHMQTLAYISCVDIASHHLAETIARGTQYFVYLPNPEKATLTFADELELEYELLLEEEDEEPACGDCGGCCECLGEPPDCRWDTTAEMDDFYQEIY